VRHNNLKGFDLDLPLHRLIVVTGLSGSGKSSLAFDTLFAEGQRRYIETFTPYARQFFDRMDKPQVDAIEGIPPAIAIEQRNAVRTTRSTVGTLTEIGDYLKLLWAAIAELRCRQCGAIVRRDTPRQLWNALRAGPPSSQADEAVLITFDLNLGGALPLEDCLALVGRQGYTRLLVDGQIVRREEAPALWASTPPRTLTVIQDRVPLEGSQRARFVEGCEQAYHFGKGRLTLHRLRPASSLRVLDGSGQPFSNRLHCAACDLEYREPVPALFSFNHPLGACPKCRGFGRVIGIDERRVIPDRGKTLAGGAVKPWQSGQSVECQRDLLRFCRARDIPTDVPFARLSPEHQRWIVEGDPDYGSDPEHEWPRAWYGVRGYFRWLESKAYKMHVRVLLSRYRSYQTCPTCGGGRLQPEALDYRLPRPTSGPPGVSPDTSLSLADFYRLPIAEALAWARAVRRDKSWSAADPLGMAMNDVCSRLEYLVEVGLGYLTLDRPTRTLSGGETERVNLTACLGSRLVNTLYVLDEPSVGLHPRDTARLVRLLERLRDAGNTVVVVEHETAVIQAADHVVDLGPGHGEAGGNLVYTGPCAGLLACAESLTGQYLSGRRQIPRPHRRPVSPPPTLIHGAKTESATTRQRSGRRRRGSAIAQPPSDADSQGIPPCAWLRLDHAQRHNLQDLTVEIPLGRFVCVTGVSGSGKTTLIKEVLVPLLSAQRTASANAGPPTNDPIEEGFDDEERETAQRDLASATLSGGHGLDRIVLVDQSPLARTPRSNPAVFIGAFDEIRALFAQSEQARRRGLGASAFSFNSAEGQCERCRGAGFERIEMQFLSDVFIRCPDCGGRRYRPHVLQVRLKPGSPQDPLAAAERTIADLLDSTVDEAVVFLNGFSESAPARRAAARLQTLRAIGLGYLRLGQPINTLSGGESQRLKLVRHLAELEIEPGSANGCEPARAGSGPCRRPGSFLFLFDEPTTGLHFEDVRILLEGFQGLVDRGHSLVVIEHNIEVIRCADWVIDLGPDAGVDGGRLVVAGTPETVAACAASHTGAALREREDLSIHSLRPGGSRGTVRAP